MLFKKEKPKREMPETVTFIENAGGCICTKSVLYGETRLKWCFREESRNPVDNGWRFLGESDTDEYINVTENNGVVDFNTVATIEPAVLGIYSMPVGTDLRFEIVAGKGRVFYDTRTNEEVPVTY